MAVGILAISPQRAFLLENTAGRRMSPLGMASQNISAAGLDALPGRRRWQSPPYWGRMAQIALD